MIHSIFVIRLPLSDDVTLLASTLETELEEWKRIIGCIGLGAWVEKPSLAQKKMMLVPKIFTSKSTDYRIAYSFNVKGGFMIAVLFSLERYDSTESVFSAFPLLNESLSVSSRIAWEEIIMKSMAEYNEKLEVKRIIQERLRKQAREQERFRSLVPVSGSRGREEEYGGTLVDELKATGFDEGGETWEEVEKGDAPEDDMYYEEEDEDDFVEDEERGMEEVEVEAKKEEEMEEEEEIEEEMEQEEDECDDEWESESSGTEEASEGSDTEDVKEQKPAEDIFKVSAKQLKRKKRMGAMIVLLPCMLCYACLACPCEWFHWGPTFMRMTLLAPKVLIISSFFLPFAAIAGIFLVPTVGVLVTATTNGRMGMFQHKKGHNITPEVIRSGIWTIVMITLSIILPIVLDVGTSFQVGMAVCSGLILLPALPAILMTSKERAMYLPGPKENASFWGKLPFRKTPIRLNVSNILAVFSLLLEYVQLLALGYSASRPSLAVEVDASFIGSLTAFTLRPLGTSLLIQWIVSACLAAILIGFLTVSILLTSQPETRVARVTEKQELEGNLSWFKLMVAFLADTLYLSLMSSMLTFLSASSAGLNGDLDTSNNASSADLSDAQFRGLSVLSLLQFLAFVSCSLLIILPIQAVFPQIWLPDGVDVRASPKFSLIEKSLKTLLVGALSLGPASNVDFRSAFACGIFAVLSVLICVLKKPMTHHFAKDFRVFGFVSALGTVIVLRVIPGSQAPIAFGAFIGTMAAGLGGVTLWSRMAWQRENKKETEKLRSDLDRIAKTIWPENSFSSMS